MRSGRKYAKNKERSLGSSGRIKEEKGKMKKEGAALKIEVGRGRRRKREELEGKQEDGVEERRGRRQGDDNMETRKGKKTIEEYGCER